MGSGGSNPWDQSPSPIRVGWRDPVNWLIGFAIMMPIAFITFMVIALVESMPAVPGKCLAHELKWVDGQSTRVCIEWDTR